MFEFLDELKYNEKGLIPVITQDVDTKQVLMMAWATKESLAETIQSKKAVYFSRSRQKRWCKGETSGHFQHIVDIKIDCDLDTVLYLVKQEGAACHTGNYSCFYRKLTKEGIEENG